MMTMNGQPSHEKLDSGSWASAYFAATGLLVHYGSGAVRTLALTTALTHSDEFAIPGLDYCTDSFWRKNLHKRIRSRTSARVETVLQGAGLPIGPPLPGFPKSQTKKDTWVGLPSWLPHLNRICIKMGQHPARWRKFPRRDRYYLIRGYAPTKWEWTQPPNPTLWYRLYTLILRSLDPLYAEEKAQSWRLWWKERWLLRNTRTPSTPPGSILFFSDATRSWLKTIEQGVFS